MLLLLVRLSYELLYNWVSTHECCFNAPVLGARLMFGCPGFLLQGDGNMLFAFAHLSFSRITQESCQGIFVGVGSVTSSKWLDFVDDVDHIADPGIFKSNFFRLDA